VAGVITAYLANVEGSANSNGQSADFLPVRLSNEYAYCPLVRVTVVWDRRRSRERLGNPVIPWHRSNPLGVKELA